MLSTAKLIEGGKEKGLVTSAYLQKINTTSYPISYHITYIFPGEPFALKYTPKLKLMLCINACIFMCVYIYTYR